MRPSIIFLMFLGVSGPVLADHDQNQRAKRPLGPKGGVPANCSIEAFAGKQFTAEGGEVLTFQQNGTMTYLRANQVQEYRYEVFRAKGFCQIMLYKGKAEMEVLTSTIGNLSTITHGTYLFSAVGNDI